MKAIAIVASLASIAVASNVTTTVTCPDDEVSRSPLPTTSCDSPSPTVAQTGAAYSTGAMNPDAASSQPGSQPGNSTSVPITGGAGSIAGGALVAVMAFVALL
ncbi:hypothetical protein MY11210_004524 [Beauveria gryllotalpidicola]